MSPQEFEQMLHDAEVKLARLKALYEQWFQGIERMEPSVPRKDLDRTFEILKKNIPRNTALRFRTQQLWARYGTYGIYWGRIARQIEEGTLRRHIVRVKKKRAAKEERTPDTAWDVDVDVEEIDGDIEGDKTDPGFVVNAGGEANGAPKDTKLPAFDEADLDAILGTLGSTPPTDPSAGKSKRPLSPFAMGGVRPAGAGASATFGKPKDKPATAVSAVASSPNTASPGVIAPRPPAAAPAPKAIPPIASAPSVEPVASPPAPPPTAAFDERRMRALYSSYIDARKQNNERSDVRFETLAESVQKMMPKLREKHGEKAIDFEVVVSNGKVGLKPKLGS